MLLLLFWYIEIVGKILLVMLWMFFFLEFFIVDLFCVRGSYGVVKFYLVGNFDWYLMSVFGDYGSIM